MGLPNWLRGREDDLDMTHDDAVHVPEIAKVEPKLSAYGNFMPVGTDIDPKKPLPFHIAPTGSIGSKPSDEASVVVQAHQFVEQWKLKDATQQKLIEQLQSDLKAEQRKSGLLELDIAQHVNTIATLQSEILALKEREEKYRQFLSVKKQINEKERLTYEQFEIDDPPKKERKPANAKKAKAERKATKETITENGTAQEKSPAI